MSANGTQFDNQHFQNLCERNGIRNHYASVAHPKSNRQVEAVKIIIKKILKKKLNTQKGSWNEEFPMVLWAYRTTERTSTGEIPFALAYGAEAT